MHIDVNSFSDAQKDFLAAIVSDFGAPTSTASILMVIEQALYTLDPEIDLSSSSIGDAELRDDLQVCMAALQHWKAQRT